jgi:hypothetical protein
MLAGHHFGFDLARLRISDATARHMKENLSALRLVHFLSVALLVGTYLKNSSPLFSYRAAGLVIETGRFSLEVFCLSAIVDVLLNIWVIVNHPHTGERMAADLVAVTLTIAVVMVMTGRRAQRREPDKVGAAP